MRIEISREARDDLEGIWSYGAQRYSVRQADAFLDEIMARIDGLLLNPRMAPPVPGLDDGTRRLVAGSGRYVIFYRPLADMIEVVRIFHHSRRASLSGRDEPG